MRVGVRDILRGFPEFRRLERDNARLRGQPGEWARFFPPGDCYSPLPSREEIAEAWARGGFGPPFAAVELNGAGQFARLERFAGWYAEQPFREQATQGARFYLDNPSHGHYEAFRL